MSPAPPPAVPALAAAAPAPTTQASARQAAAGVAALGLITAAAAATAAGSAPVVRVPLPPADQPPSPRRRSRSRSSSLGSYRSSDSELGGSDDDEEDELAPPPPAAAAARAEVEAVSGASELSHQAGPSSSSAKKQQLAPAAAAAALKKVSRAKEKDGAAPARKQNVACDPCRSRKVKCLRTNGSDKCDSCLQKSLVCTNHYVTSLQNKERRKPLGEKGARAKAASAGAAGSTGGAYVMDVGGQGQKRRKVSSEMLPHPQDLPSSSYRTSDGGLQRSEFAPPLWPSPSAGLSSQAGLAPHLPPPAAHSSQMQHQPNYAQFVPPALHYPAQAGAAQQQLYGTSGSGASSSSRHGQVQRPTFPFPLGADQTPLPLPALGSDALAQARRADFLVPQSFTPLQRPTSSSGGDAPSVLKPQQQLQPQALPAFPPPMGSLLAYLFSPTEVATNELGYMDQTLVGHEGGKRELFDAAPSQAHRSLLVEALRMELANDLIESYFQIVHIRMPMLAQSIFKAEFKTGTVSHVKLAVVLALGAKFSEHPIIAMDREQTSDPAVKISTAGAPVRKSTSRLVRLLVARAQQVLEVHRAYRTPTLENIQAALLMEGLLNPKPAESTPNRNVPSHSKGFWTTVAIRHLLELRANHMSTILAIADELRRGALLFAWWLACLSDSMGALFWRQKPVLCDEDYDNEPPAAWDGEHYQPIENPEEYKKWYMSAHDLAKIAREACGRLWTPRAENAGIPLAALRQLVDLLCGWRDVHLSLVAVPNQWPSSWDFVHAVTACAADSNFHVMWLTIHRAVVDFGVFEKKEMLAGRIPLSPDLSAQIESLKSQLDQEATHAATRISALAVVLTTNGYLRLDPNVLHYPIFEAGTFLARYGMPEVEGCINGLRQYGTSYEECYAQADGLQQAFDEARARGLAAAAFAQAQSQCADAAGAQDEIMQAPRAATAALEAVAPALEFQHQALALPATAAGGGASAAGAHVEQQQPPATSITAWSMQPTVAKTFTPSTSPSSAAGFHGS